ncbi:MAG: GGDEF domain-containing protein [Actinomycetia bacterium]|nr:GGDEF domain-containing protein [Actinomycetes bacterium]
MTAASLTHRGLAPEISTQADDALRVVRVVLGVLSCFVVGAYRPLTGPPSWGTLAGTLAVVGATVLSLNWLGKRFRGSRRWAIVTQALDVAAIVALAVLLDEPMGEQSWVLLVIPVVSAAVRHGTLASVLSWVGGCVGYISVAAGGLVDSGDNVTLLARVPGSLLAVAITIGLLARWMREGWEIQNGLTQSAAAREHRSRVIEQTGHALHGLAPQPALELTAGQLLALGFDAATIDYLTIDRPTFAVGRQELIAQRSSADVPLPDTGLTVTVWTNNGRICVHSVSLHEPHTGTVFTAWSENPIETERAQACATLIAHASTAIETTSRLTQLQRAADQDALTGLANRRTLDHAIERRAAQTGTMSIAFVDLDNFKSINDEHGHDIGDKTLIAVARRLEAATGTVGLVARYGGDEFVVLMPNAGLDQAKHIAQAMLRSCADPIAFGLAQLHVGLSIGLVSARTPARGASLLRAADQAVYQAKSAGKGTIIAVHANAPEAQPIRQVSTALQPGQSS